MVSRKTNLQKDERGRQLLTAIELVITKTADRKIIMNYHSRG